MVEGTAEVIWADDGGRAGVLFSRLTAVSRKYLKQWLGKRDAGKKTVVRALRGETVPREKARSEKARSEKVRSQKARRAAAGSH
jgi:hypothetical protein